MYIGFHPKYENSFKSLHLKSHNSGSVPDENCVNGKFGVLSVPSTKAQLDTCKKGERNSSQPTAQNVSVK